MYQKISKNHLKRKKKNHKNNLLILTLKLLLYLLNGEFPQRFDVSDDGCGCRAAYFQQLRVTLFGDDQRGVCRFAASAPRRPRVL